MLISGLRIGGSAALILCAEKKIAFRGHLWYKYGGRVELDLMFHNLFGYERPFGCLRRCETLSACKIYLFGRLRKPALQA